MQFNLATFSYGKCILHSLHILHKVSFSMKFFNCSHILGQIMQCLEPKRIWLCLTKAIATSLVLHNMEIISEHDNHRFIDEIMECSNPRRTVSFHQFCLRFRIGKNKVLIKFLQFHIFPKVEKRESRSSHRIFIIRKLLVILADWGI